MAAILNTYTISTVNTHSYMYCKLPFPELVLSTHVETLSCTKNLKIRDPAGDSETFLLGVVVGVTAEIFSL